MVVCPARHKIKASFNESLTHLLGVLQYLLLVLFEFRRLCHLQGDCQGGDCMIVGSTLQTWKHSRVHLLLKLIHDGFTGLIHSSLPFPEENHGTTWPTQGLVCCCGHNIGVLKRGWNNTCGYQARNVSHVSEQVRPARLSNLLHAGIVNEASISTCASNDDLRAQTDCKLLALFIIDVAGLDIQTVWDAFEVLGHVRHLLCVRLETMGKVATMRKIQ
mmetsp:Transcript_63146/g.117460  ORF Transcript_63146/g.117460 Transcript_63146/m.117460 type:complete len:217 (+) Transcript_63146:227-877(+)